ncbi:MAG: hypothetical protein ABSH48_13775 [Verrucomicrobiota bacterium]|jgi:hypothetical protein
MTKTIGRRGLWLTILYLALATPASRAVILFGSGDPAYNTTPPTGTLANSGWQFEGQWNCFLGTAIAPNYFLAAQHIGGSVGDIFTLNGSNYITTAYWDDPGSDLRLWQVSGTFTNYAPLYSTSDEQGKSLVVIGRGTQRGPAVTVTWTPPDTTNEVTTLAGWEDGPCDGVERWGQNQVQTAGGWLLIVAFTGTQGPNEGYLSGGDSSGAVFIQDDTGAWNLAGINYGVDGPFSTTASGPQFCGAIFNEDGLYVGGVVQIPLDGVTRPTHFYASRVSSELYWIQSIVGVVPPAQSPTPALPPALSIQCAGGNVIVSYPTNSVGCTLQSSSLTGGGSPAWQPVTNSAVVNGTNWNITVPIAGAGANFRLQSTN